jgi:hypothetical protein
MADSVVTVSVEPGYPDTPVSIQIDGIEWDDSETVQLLIDDVFKANVPVIVGVGTLNYLLTGGDKSKVSNLIAATARIDAIGGAGSTIVKFGDGSHSIELRYAP